MKMATLTHFHPENADQPVTFGGSKISWVSKGVLSRSRWMWLPRTERGEGVATVETPSEMTADMRRECHPGKS